MLVARDPARTQPQQLATTSNYNTAGLLVLHSLEADHWRSNCHKLVAVMLIYPGCFLEGTCTGFVTCWHWHRNFWHHCLPGALQYSCWHHIWPLLPFCPKTWRQYNRDLMDMWHFDLSFNVIWLIIWLILALELFYVASQIWLRLRPDLSSEIRLDQAPTRIWEIGICYTPTAGERAFSYSGPASSSSLFGMHHVSA